VPSGGAASRLVIVEEEAARARQAFDPALKGLPDCQATLATGLTVNHRREILTGAVYKACSGAGSPAAVDATVAPALGGRVPVVWLYWSRRAIRASHRGAPKPRSASLIQTRAGVPLSPESVQNMRYRRL